LDQDNPQGSGGSQVCLSIYGESQGCGFNPPLSSTGNDAFGSLLAAASNLDDFNPVTTFWGFMDGYWNKVPITLTAYYPVPQTRGMVQIQVPLSILPQQGVVCVGGGVALGSPTDKYVSAGPLLFGDLNNAQAVLSGFSWNIGAQPTPLVGYQGTVNKSGELNGPTFSTGTGFTVGGSVSGCGSYKKN